MRNLFKNGIEPTKQDAKTIKLRNGKEVTLNPPKFEDDLVTIHNPNITWGMSLKKAENGRFI